MVQGTLAATILWIHLFSAVLFVGGSFFMWIVVIPVSRVIVEDEGERTLIVGKMAKAFGRIAVPALFILVLTGAYNMSWYLPSLDALIATRNGNILLVKIILVIALLILIYIHNVYFGKKILKLAEEKKFEELKALRRVSRIASFTNLALMAAILVLSTLMQIPV